MADDFGLKIGLEGEKEFKKALADINQSFKVLGSEMKVVQSQFDQNDSSVEALTARNQVLNKEIDAQRQKIDTLRSALKNASGSFGENDRRTQNWQIQLNNATAALNDMERELSDNEKALDDVGKELGDAGKEADDFGDELKEAGNDADTSGGKFEKLGSIVKGVAAAMGAALAAIGTASVAAGKALVDMTVEAAAYADEMITQSTVTGMSVESLQAYAYAADLVDVSLDTLTGSMAKNVKSMSNAAQGSAKYAEAYEKLGISVTNADGSLRNSEEVYWEVIDALGRVSNETERDAIAMQLFGKSAQELNPLIAQGSEGIAALTEEAKRMGAVLSEETIEKLGAFDDSVQRLKQGSEAAKRVMGTVLLPQLQTLADDGVALLGQFTSGLAEAGTDFEKISEVIGQTVGGLVSIIMEHLPHLIQVGMEIVMAIGGAIADNLPTLVECASTVIMTFLDGLIAALPQLTTGALQLVLALADGIVENLPALTDAAIQMIAMLATGIAEALPELIPAVVQMLTTIIQTLLDNLPLLLDAALQLIMGLAQGLLDAIPVLIESLPTIISAIVDFLISAIPQIIETGIQLLTALVDALPEIIDAIVEALPQIIDGIVTGLLEGLPLIVQAGIDLLVALIQALPEIIETIIAALPQIITAIVDALIGSIPQIVETGVTLFISLIENLPIMIVEIVKAVPQIIAGLVQAFTESIPKIVEVGANLVKGLWDGIQSMISWLWDKVTGWVDGLVGGIKSLLGIHSPSTVFAGIGENMGAGIGVGFVDAMKGVEQDMQKAIPTSFNIDTNLDGMTPTPGGSGHAFNVTISLTIDGTTLARILAEIQWSQNAVFVRNLGTA